MPFIMALISGTLFGFGLALSDMMNPGRVLAFLDVSGDWDPTLMFVMGGALLVTTPVFQIVSKKCGPFCGHAYQLPNKRRIDSNLIIGAVLFGVGWGLIGICPGPAIAAMMSGRQEIFVLMGSLLVGLFLVQLLPPLNRKR